LALIGPYFAPYSQTGSIALPYLEPSQDYLLGTDALGRDVLSRVLWGGRHLLVLAAVSTLLALALGLAIGLTAGLVRRADWFLVRILDVWLAMPGILFVLVIIASFGRSTAVVVAAVGAGLTPSLARLVRAATLEVSVRGYVEAAIARGERLPAIMWREILPNIRTVLLADVGIRFTIAVLSIAGLNFLGVGLKPPAADWGVMVSENREGLEVNPAAVLVPALLVALLAVSSNLVADGVAHSLGRSTDTNPARV